MVFIVKGTGINYLNNHQLPCSPDRFTDKSHFPKPLRNLEDLLLQNIETNQVYCHQCPKEWYFSLVSKYGIANHWNKIVSFSYIYVVDNGCPRINITLWALIKCFALLRYKREHSWFHKHYLIAGITPKHPRGL